MRRLRHQKAKNPGMVGLPDLVIGARIERWSKEQRVLKFGSSAHIPLVENMEFFRIPNLLRLGFRQKLPTLLKSTDGNDGRKKEKAETMIKPAFLGDYISWEKLLRTQYSRRSLHWQGLRADEGGEKIAFSFQY